MFHCWSSAHYTLPLPAGHRFPIEKYALLRDAVLAEGIVPRERMHDPERATREELLRVHTAGYVDRLGEGRLTEAEIRRLGFPWSPQLVERSYRAVGGTLGATRAALRHGVAMNLAGGTHHAFPDHGEGFCVFNDVAVAVRALLDAGEIARAAVVDLDVHQGNGTHAIFAGEERVHTFSMHGERNYPYRESAPVGDASDPRRYGVRVPGTRDVDLPEGVGDDEYLAVLAAELPAVLAAARPDLVVYLGGADPHEGDRLGRMRLTFDGLARRDTLVLESCREVGIPVAITIAGGYGRDIRDTVRIHTTTARIARKFATSP
ncbi:MAG TPA: histone deacetylase [Gemmatimonadaceae bacterium]|nr:histone deacetylase [Gemmatimonadaceae bacterium]